jgi:hypothetical protein
MLIVKASVPQHYIWLAVRSGTELTEGFRAIEVLDDRQESCPYCHIVHGRIRAMTGYSSWTPNSVTMHVAGDEEDTSDRAEVGATLLGPSFQYPFVEQNRKLALIGVISSNAKSLAMCARLGFVETHRVQQGWDDTTDLVLFSMRREDCRWLDRR